MGINVEIVMDKSVTLFSALFDQCCGFVTGHSQPFDDGADLEIMRAVNAEVEAVRDLLGNNGAPPADNDAVPLYRQRQYVSAEEPEVILVALPMGRKCQ